MTGIHIKLKLHEYGFKQNKTIDGKLCFTKGGIIVSLYRTTNMILLVRITAGSRMTTLIRAEDIKNILEVENSLYLTDCHNNDLEVRYGKD